MMKKRLAVLLVTAMLAGLMGCSGGSNSQEEPAAPAEAQEETPAAEDTQEAEEPAESEQASAEDKVYIGAVAAEAGIPYFTTMQWGALDAARDYNVELYWTGPSEWDFSKQQSFIDGVIQTNPDALLLVPTDSDAYISYDGRL